MDSKIPDISIIIPVYKTERYLRRCLESVVGQPAVSSGNVEVLVVNDCSPDGARAIILDYSRRFESLRPVDLSENRGVAEARNVGIEQAHGRYLMFLDSDDALEPCALSVVLGTIRECSPDYIKFLHTRMTDGGKILFVKTTTAYGLLDVSQSAIESVKDVFENIVLNMMGWNGVYRREIVGKIRFSSDFPISEDSLFALQCACVSQRFYIINIPLYRYYQRDESLTQATSQRAVAGLIELIGRYWDVCEGAEWLNPVHPLIVRRLTFFMLGWLRALVFCEKSDCKGLRVAYFSALRQLCRRKGACRGLRTLYPLLMAAAFSESEGLLAVAGGYARIRQAVARRIFRVLPFCGGEHFAMV